MTRWLGGSGCVVMVGVLSLGLVHGVWGYHPVLNVGESLQGWVFLCRPLGAEEAVSRGTVVQYTPSTRIRDLVRSLVPQADLHLPWLKRVVAIAGDAVCWRGEWLYINDGAVALLQRSLQAVAPASATCLTLQSGEVLPLGDAVASFDGRYHGPLSRGEVGEICHTLW